jgi:nitric oxide reductase large subunit
MGYSPNCATTTCIQCCNYYGSCPENYAPAYYYSSAYTTCYYYYQDLSGPSTATIALAVIVSILATVIIAAVIYYCYKKWKEEKEIQMEELYQQRQSQDHNKIYVVFDNKFKEAYSGEGLKPMKR